MPAADDRPRATAGHEPDRGRDAHERSERRERARRRTLLQRAFAAVCLAALIAGLALWLGGSSGRPRSSPSGRSRPLTKRARAPRAATPKQRAAPSPGSLPQTHAFPSATSAQFKSLMDSLWAGIVRDSLAQALPAFFPKGAYVQLKAIASASSDWSGRLVHDYGLDVEAAHALLGAGAQSARLIGVNVPSSYGHWVEPGVCENSIGYYEMPNARVSYREAGQLRSFGIASMISWRGVWYVVHLGAVLRSADSGTVDEPALGAGTSAYSGTC
jgi:hypothetical protein